MHQPASRSRKSASLYVTALFFMLGLLLSLPTPSQALEAPGTYVFESFAEYEEPGNLRTVHGGEASELLPFWAENPVLSPDGERIAYERSDSEDGDIYITTLRDGYGPRKIFDWSDSPWAPPPVPTELAWDPDELSLVFIGGAEGNRIIEATMRKGLDENGMWRSFSIVTKGSGLINSPSISPDGSQLAYGWKASGKEKGSEGGIYVGDRYAFESPESVAPATWPTEEEPFSAYGAKFAPGGDKLILLGSAPSVGAQIFSLDISEHSVTQLTEFPGYSSAYRVNLGSVSVSPAGVIIFPAHVGEEPEGEEEDERTWQLRGINSTGSEEITIEGPQPEPLTYASAKTPKAAVEIDEFDAYGYLYAYAPTLRYDFGEIFWAVKADATTYIYEGEEPEESNALRRSGGETIAYSNPLLSSTPLSLDYLNGPGGSSEYNDPLTSPSPLVGSKDYISFVGNELWTYHDSMIAYQENPLNIGKVYAHLIHAGSNWWLQYWIFYYYNAKGGFGIGVHEGDWEMVQYRLDSAGVPDRAYYAQHKDGESCLFEELEFSLGAYSTTSPRVFVAVESHASYFHSGEHLNGIPADDTAGGDGETHYAKIIPVDGSEGWLNWPGQWGDSGASPEGPKQKDEWDSPGETYNSGDECGSAAPSP